MQFYGIFLRISIISLVVVDIDQIATRF